MFRKGYMEEMSVVRCQSSVLKWVLGLATLVFVCLLIYRALDLC